MANEGQMTVDMMAPVEMIPIKLCTQVTNVTRPLLWVTKITEEGKLRVMCDQNKAVVVDLQGKVLATFRRKNGLHVCLMKVKNPMYKDKQLFSVCSVHHSCCLSFFSLIDFSSCCSECIGSVVASRNEGKGLKMDLEAALSDNISVE